MDNMIDYGFIRIAAAVPRMKVADCGNNSDGIKELIRKAYGQGVRIVV
ncbi:MAG: hypothetical protein HGA22_08970, partial [Clostridiales bacterium]|nr:hypothetical protein [Clostridiales bacterium]